MSRLFLIRHGETEGNALRILQHPDIPLSSRGIAQAERLARRLAREGITRIVSSDYARAMTTAEKSVSHVSSAASDTTWHAESWLTRQNLRRSNLLRVI